MVPRETAREGVWTAPPSVGSMTRKKEPGKAEDFEAGMIDRRVLEGTHQAEFAQK